jgi:hypothetical protein
MDGELAHRKAATWTQDNTNTNKRSQTSMSQVEFEPTIPVFELVKTVHALERSATVIGSTYTRNCNSVGEIITELPLTKLVNAYWIINNICTLLPSVTPFM